MTHSNIQHCAHIQICIACLVRLFTQQHPHGQKRIMTCLNNNQRWRHFRLLTESRRKFPSCSPRNRKDSRVVERSTRRKCLCQKCICFHNEIEYVDSGIRKVWKLVEIAFCGSELGNYPHTFTVWGLLAYYLRVLYCTEGFRECTIDTDQHCHCSRAHRNWSPKATNV